MWGLRNLYNSESAVAELFPFLCPRHKLGAPFLECPMRPLVHTSRTQTRVSCISKTQTQPACRTRAERGTGFKTGFRKPKSMPGPRLPPGGGALNGHGGCGAGRTVLEGRHHARVKRRSQFGQQQHAKGAGQGPGIPDDKDKTYTYRQVVINIAIIPFSTPVF